MTEDEERGVLADVIITDELTRRPSRDPDLAAENEALCSLAETAASRPDKLLQHVVDATLTLTGAESAGISLLDAEGEASELRWVATGGRIAKNLNGTLEWTASPCGEVIARNALMLFKEPARAFPTLNDTIPRIYEAVLAPLPVDDRPAGALWAIQHSPDKTFEREDARILQRLIRFATASHRQVRALQAARENEARYRLIVESAKDYAILVADPDDIIIDWLPGAEAVFGWTRAEAIGQPAGITFTAEDRQAGVPHQELETAARTGTAPDVRWHERKDGSHVFIEGSVTPLRREDGRIHAFLKIGQDLSVQRSVQEALEASERRMRSLVTGIPQLVFRSNGVGERSWVSPQWTRYTGLPFEQSVGLGWLKAIHPEDRERTLAAWRGLTENDYFQVEHRIHYAATGAHRWHQTRAIPSRDEAGRVVEWLGTSTDVEELRRLQRRAEMLFAELQHRVRNTLSVIRSIMRRTADSSDSVEDMAMHLEGRIGAFSRIQAAMARSQDAGVELTELIADELLAVAAKEGEQLRISGPEISFRLRAAETICLAIHELATNSIKYGALSVERGTLDVRWNRRRSADQDELEFVWEENGLDLAPGEPPRRGFGLELLERTIPYELDADAAIEFRPEGVRFRMIIPLARHVIGTDTLV